MQSFLGLDSTKFITHICAYAEMLTLGIFFTRMLQTQLTSLCICSSLDIKQTENTCKQNKRTPSLTGNEKYLLSCWFGCSCAIVKIFLKTVLLFCANLEFEVLYVGWLRMLQVETSLILFYVA